MRALIISMQSSRRRRHNAIAQIKISGLRYEIVDGIDARLWREDALPMDASTREWMIPGEVGCYLAHLAALQRIIDYDLPWACVLEDDFCYEADPDVGLAEIESVLPDQFDYIHLQRELGWNPKFKAGERCGFFERIVSTPLGATGYIASRAFAELVIREYSYVRRPIDHLYNELAGGDLPHRIIAYRTTLPIVGVSVSMGSDIHRSANK